MDALRRDAAILRSLLLAGPGITIVLLLIAFTAFMLAVLPDEKHVDAFLGCMFFSLVCLVARAASRLRMYCESAGRLAIPRHALAMRRAQCILIILFTLIPIAYALWIGAGFRAVVIFVGGTALAIYLAQALGLAVFFLVALKGLNAAGLDVWALLFGIPGSVLILAASAWGIVGWLRLPQRLEAEAGAASLAFSDIAHEGLAADELEAANAAFDRHLGDVLEPRAPQVLTARRLWIGLGHDPRANWRVNAIGVSLALAAVVIFHFWNKARSDLGAYLGLSAIFAAYVYGRFNQMQEAWLRTQGEQSLLVLSARWPARAAFKIVLLRSVWTGVPLLLAGWLLFSVVELAFGWIDGRSVMLAALGQVAALVSSLGMFLSYFAYSRVPRTNWLQMVYLLTALAGIATLLTSLAHGFVPGALVGAGLLLAPSAVAFLAFFLRPALFPVQITLRK